MKALDVHLRCGSVELEGGVGATRPVQGAVDAADGRAVAFRLSKVLVVALLRLVRDSIPTERFGSGVVVVGACSQGPWRVNPPMHSFKEHRGVGGREVEMPVSTRNVSVAPSVFASSNAQPSVASLSVDLSAMRP